jgi:hypothetical protein
VVSLATFERLVVDESKLVFLLFVSGQREQVVSQAVFGLLVRDVFTKVVYQFAVGAVGLGHGLTAEGLVLTLVPVPSRQLLERSSGMVGLGDNVIVSTFFAQDFAVRLFGNHLNVLMIDVLASQLLAAVLIGRDTRHDGFGSQ